MPNYPMPLGQCCDCDEPDPCECEDGVPAGILIELGELASLSVPFEEGVTEYFGSTTFDLDSDNVFNYIDYYSKKCTDYQKKLIDSEPFVYRSEVAKWLQWLYLHLAETVTIVYQFDIDPDNCTITNMLFSINFNSYVLSKPFASRTDLCQVPDSGSVHSEVSQVLYDFAELDTNCSFFFMPDIDVHQVACDWSLERDEVDPDIVGYTFPCTVDGVNETYDEDPEPDYDAEEILIQTHEHDGLDYGPEDVLDWCEELVEGVIYETTLGEFQNYPTGWGNGYIWDCEPVDEFETLCTVMTPPVFDACELVYTPTLPDYSEVELKISLYYAP